MFFLQGMIQNSSIRQSSVSPYGGNPINMITEKSYFEIAKNIIQILLYNFYFTWTWQIAVKLISSSIQKAPAHSKSIKVKDCIVIFHTTCGYIAYVNLNLTTKKLVLILLHVQPHCQYLQIAKKRFAPYFLDHDLPDSSAPENKLLPLNFN